MFAIEHREQPCQTLFDRSRFQQFLALLQTQIQVDGDQIGKMAGVFGVQSRDFDLL